MQLEDSQVPEPTLTVSQMNPELKYGRSVSLMQAAALLQVSRRTIYNRIRDGQLATIRIHGSQRVLTSSLFGSNGLVQDPSATTTVFDAQL
jgi:excisionase family DNA binding protein